MAGHSKWANIKHKKAAQDAKRSKHFMKYSKDILIAIKDGGSDPEQNARLRTAIQTAKAGNMPNDNIKRLLEKANKDNSDWQELTYEGYGPGGVAVLVECVTDNVNRTAAYVKSSFSKGGGNMGTTGSVSYMFHTKGIIVLDPEVVDSEKAMEIALMAEATDIKDQDGVIVVETEPTNLLSTKEAFEAEGITEFLTAEVSKVPDMKVELSEEQNDKLQKLIDLLEESDDVNDVHTNVE